MARPVNKADTHELRLARLLFAEGAFVRRAIDLNMRFGEDLTVTDLDVLALRFRGDLTVELSIGEVKTGLGKKGPKLADRLLWLRGLRALVEADSAFVATLKRSSARVRGLAERLDVAVIDEQDLIHREQANGIGNDSPWGPYDPRLLERQRDVYEAIKADKDLKRIYWFVRSEFWLLETTTGVKRAFGAMRILTRQWEDKKGAPVGESIRWLARQLQVNIVVGLVKMAGRSYAEEPRRSSEWLLRELASGPGLDYETLRNISNQVDQYVTAVLRDVEADPGKQVGALGAFSPAPPAYSESLVEVLQRLAAEPEVAAALPRFVDWRLAGLELGEQSRGPRTREDLAPDCERLLRLVGAFITGQLKASPEILGGVLALRGPAKPQDPVESPPPGQRADAGKREQEPDRSKAQLFDDLGGTLKPL
jgi:hypothetical protein